MTDFNALEVQFQHPQVQQWFGNLQHCLGFICAVASSPEKIAAKEWMQQLCRENPAKVKFESPSIAQNLSNALVSWWRNCDQHFDHSERLMLPPTLALEENGRANPALQSFATGYLHAYQWLSATWQNALQHQSKEAERSVSLLVNIFSRWVDEDQFISQQKASLVYLPEPTQCWLSLPKLLTAVGMLGKDIQQQSTTHQQRAVHVPHHQEGLHSPLRNPQRGLGRNELCPCGSGKKFKKCCLH